MKRFVLPALVIGSVLVMGVALTGCKKEGAAEKAGAEIDKASEELQDATKDATKAVEDANKALGGE